MAYCSHAQPASAYPATQYIQSSRTPSNAIKATKQSRGATNPHLFRGVHLPTFTFFRARLSGTLKRNLFYLHTVLDLG